MKSISNLRGFTLAEMIIVVVIIAILSTLGFVSYTRYTSQARDAGRSTDAKNISTVLNLHKVHKLTFPSPTDPVNITYSGATVWTQGVFGQDTIRETGKIFGALEDPLYKNQYSYSVTNNKKEYQLGVLFESESRVGELLSFQRPDFIAEAYASDPFSPDELNPTIWLDALDVDGDGDMTDNPSNNSNISSWKNKSSAGATNDPSIDDGNLKYSTSGYDGSYPAIFISSNRGLELNNSDITQGDIFYVVQNNDPFNGTDGNGRGLQSTTGNYLIGYHWKRRHALYINGSPDHYNKSPATTSGRKTYPFIYGFHTNDTNYEFYDTGVSISAGSTNSITGREWGFNKAGAVNERADFVVSEILVFDSKLSPADRQKVEGYLAHKWGQDTWLPGGHPYKSDPPESSGPPPTPDTTPELFTLSDVSNADLGVVYTSNSFIVTGINTPTSISISGGSYSINSTSSEDYTNSGGFVSSGDEVRVRTTSSLSNNTSSTATLNIGGVVEDFVVTTLVADITPDIFSFDFVNDADISTQYTSNSVTISGLNTTANISITGGGAEYRISDGVPYDVSGAGSASASHQESGSEAYRAFDNNTSNSGWGNTGSLPAQLQYDLGNGGAKIVSKYTLFRSSSDVGGWYSCDSPRNWTFEGSNNGSSWSVLDTQTNGYVYFDDTKKEYSIGSPGLYRYYRLNVSSSRCGSDDWVNITEIELIDSGGSGVYTSSSGTVENGDTISLQMTSSANAGTSATGTLSVGTLNADYVISTIAPDTTPDGFSFDDEIDAPLGSTQTSNLITIAGINTSTSISISGDGGSYSINGGAFTSVAGTISSGNTVRVRLVASSSNSITKSTVLTIGGVEATYNVTTPAPPPDSVPDPFVFVDKTDALIGSEYVSNTITISGMNTSTGITISDGEYDINSSNIFTSAAGTVSNGDKISIKNTSSSTAGVSVDATLTIGGISDTYTITTVDPDITPDSYIISDKTNTTVDTEYDSDAFEITGINSPTEIGISGNSATYSINGGAFTSGSGTVNNGDDIIIRMTSSSTWEGSVSTNVNVGGVLESFQLTNGVGDTTPDTFLFNSETDVALNSQQTSNTVVITGLTAPVSISISPGGEYRIGPSGDFTSSIGTIENNQELTLRQVSSISGLTTTEITVNVGGEQVGYSVTTLDYVAPISDTGSSLSAQSQVYLIGEYNGLISHAQNGEDHYILATPSIMTYDTDDTDFTSIIENKKLVYRGYNNIPASYAGNDLIMDGGFDFGLRDPLLYSGTKEDLGAYGGLKQVDEGIKNSYASFPDYRSVASYLDSRSLNYLENIIGDVIGINPIKPFYCSDILESKLITNVASNATITATPSTTWGVSGTGGIANGTVSTLGDLDYEYHSDTPNAFINFAWDSPQAIGFLRIYNRTGCCSDRLSGATIKLFNQFGGLIYSHPLWNTNGDYVIDLDLEGIGHLHQVSELRIETVGGNYLNLREVEIYLGGNIKSGTYKVDKDGLGGQSPYNVYCDMVTDGGGWTRIGENYIHNGMFAGGADIEEYTFNEALGVNVIKSPSTVAPPSSIPEAFVLQHNGSPTESYSLEFDTIPGDFFAQEIRLTAWVKGTNSSIFENTINYDDSTSVTSQPDYEVLDSTDDGWELHRARIPLDGLVSDFRWDVANTIAGPIFMTGFNMEVYYR